jgi:hypothetical protein
VLQSSRTKRASCNCSSVLLCVPIAPPEQHFAGICAKPRQASACGH